MLIPSERISFNRHAERLWHARFHAMVTIYDVRDILVRPLTSSDLTVSIFVEYMQHRMLLVPILPSHRNADHRTELPPSGCC